MHSVAWLVVAAGLAGADPSQVDVFDRAVAALSSGDYRAAERGFLEVLQVSPGSVAALQNLGLVYARTERLNQAIATYRRVLDLSPGNQSTLLNLGLAYMKQKSFGEAMSVFDSLVRADPASSPARDIRLLYPLCDGYLKQNQTPEAPRKLVAFLAGVPPATASLVTCKLYYVRDRLEDAEKQCRKTLEIDPDFAGARLELARVLVSRHSPEAERELAAAIREGPTDPEAVYDLGVALLQEGRLDEASLFLDRSRRLDPGFWGSYFNLGKLKLRSGQAEQAVGLLQRAAEMHPDDFSVFYELGRALTAAGQTEEARRAMDRVRELVATESEHDATALRKR